MISYSSPEKTMSKETFLEYFGLPGILGERLFAVFDGLFFRHFPQKILIHIYDSLKNISKFNYEITCKEKLNYKKRHKLLLRRLKFNLISVAFHYARTRRSWAPIGPKDSFALQFADACKPRLTFLAAGISMDDDGCGRINCKLGERRTNFQMLLSLNSD